MPTPRVVIVAGLPIDDISFVGDRSPNGRRQSASLAVVCLHPYARPVRRCMRLEQKWGESEWKLTEIRQRAKYQQLTAPGKNQVASNHESWLQQMQAIGGVMAPEIL
jgi:hypothetical protein